MLPNNAECLSIVAKKGRFDISVIFRVAEVLRQRKIDVVHAFLFDAEVITRLAARFTKVKLVVASERNTNYSQPGFQKLALKVTQPFFDVMIANSEAGKQFNVTTRGIRSERIEVVRNGVDVKRFSPNPTAGAAIRAELKIPASDPVVGMVGSFKYQKGHEFFLRMAAEVLKEFPNAWFLVLGEVPERASPVYYQETMALAKSLNLGDRCRFLGARNDMDAVYNSFDVMTLLSRHEGTPNVVLEAMASGVPVVATDVSDNRFIIEEGMTGHIVPVGEVALPAARVSALIRNPEGRRTMGEKARAHVCREFSFQGTTTKLADIYDKYLARK
jgi:glycosyltransferase involved in cell wall biosynthesis